MHQSGRLASSLLAALALAGAYGCGAAGGGGTYTVPPEPTYWIAQAPPMPTPSAYAQLAASSVAVAFGDSIALGIEADFGYPGLLGQYVGAASVSNLAIGGVTAAQAAAQELPLLPAGCGLVTINLGTNDLDAIGGDRGGPGEPLSAATNALQAIVATSKQKCPAAQILIATVVNNIRSQRGDDMLNAWIRTGPLGATVVDLQNDPRLHLRANFAASGVHPDDAGQTIMAQDFGSAVR
jgi:lysophospholipase L1-like esterase